MNESGRAVAPAPVSYVAIISGASGMSKVYLGILRIISVNVLRQTDSYLQT